MQTEIRAERDLKNTLIFAYRARIKQIEDLEKKVRDYDPNHSDTNMDELFTSASALRSRRIDFAIYNFAMQTRKKDNGERINEARQRALKELQRFLDKFKKNGLDAWSATIY